MAANVPEFILRKYPTQNHFTSGLFDRPVRGNRKSGSAWLAALMDVSIMSFETFMFTCMLLAVTLSKVYAEHDLTVDVGAGVTECFYQKISGETWLEIEYQVIDGGDLDISFYVRTPEGRVLAAEMKKNDAIHRFDVKTAGDYKICFDNSFSRFSNKIVYFEVSTGETEDEQLEKWEDVQDEMEELVEVTLEYFKDRVDNVRTNLDKSMQIQTVLRMHEARDRNIVENNFDRVNIWSGIQLFIMISVSLAQVLMIRNLFDDKSKVGQTKVRT